MRIANAHVFTGKTTWACCLAAILAVQAGAAESDARGSFGAFLRQAVTNAGKPNATAGEAGVASGLKGEYFDNRELQGAPRLTRIDPRLSFNWGEWSPGAGLPADQFSVRWTGWLRPIYSEPYVICGNRDDGIRIWVDDRLVVDAWNESNFGDFASAPVPLGAGRTVRLKVEYLELRGGARLDVRWRSASQREETIPDHCLIPETIGQPSGDGQTTAATTGNVAARKSTELFGGLIRITREAREPKATTPTVEQGAREVAGGTAPRSLGEVLGRALGAGAQPTPTPTSRAPASGPATPPGGPPPPGGTVVAASPPPVASGATVGSPAAPPSVVGPGPASMTPGTVAESSAADERAVAAQLDRLAQALAIRDLAGSVSLFAPALQPQVREAFSDDPERMAILGEALRQPRSISCSAMQPAGTEGAVQTAEVAVTTADRAYYLNLAKVAGEWRVNSI